MTTVETRLGPPTVRATPAHGRWYAHEGTHRLTVAAELGVPVVLRPTRWAWSRGALWRAARRTRVVEVEARVEG